MTPQRLQLLLEHFRRRDAATVSPARHRTLVAHLLGFDRRTLVRWLDGEQPAPRVVAMMLETMYRNPTITGPVLERWLHGGPVPWPDYVSSQKLPGPAADPLPRGWYTWTPQTNTVHWTRTFAPCGACRPLPTCITISGAPASIAGIATVCTRPSPRC